jgi:hypothetical protein
MMVMPTSYTSFTKYFNRFIRNHCTFGEIGNETGALVDSYWAIVMVITLALPACVFNKPPFIAIRKIFNYSYHTNTSKLSEVMIDASHRLAYPLVKRLEDITNGIGVPKGDGENGK